MEPLYICIRRTLPWHDEEAVAAGLAKDLRAKVPIWNACFSVRFPAFRVRLMQIAQENLSRIENAKLVRHAEIPAGALMVPVDDDDWFSPELANVLLAEGNSAPHGYHWTPFILEAPRRKQRWPWARTYRATDTSSHTCGSNNYAIRNLPELAEGIRSHVWAGQHFDANLGRVKRLEANLSVQNRNFASRSGLDRHKLELSREQLIARFERYRSLYDRLRLPPEVAWAQPCVAAMAELMRSVRIL